MKIAWFTPFGVSSAIGSYSQEIVESLVLRDEVTLFVSNGDIAGLDVRKTGVPIVGFDEASLSQTCDRIRDFDIVVYNMGDYFHYHELPFLTKARVPGIVVLHDVVMRDFYRGYCDLYLNEYKLFQRFQ